MTTAYTYIWSLIKNNETVKTATLLDGPWTGSKIAWLPEEWQEGKSLRETSDNTDTSVRLWGPAGFDFWDSLPEIRQMESTGCFNSKSGYTVLFEVITRHPGLVILGGGHISVPVCQLGHMLGFNVTVVDDRPEFAAGERFPDADRVLCCNYSELSGKVLHGPNTYYVIVTRGHAGDEACASQLLLRDSPYIGMIGSRAKVAFIRENLINSGFSQTDAERLYAPIGLDIGAETPAEIAVSIMGEIIKVRNLRSRMTIEYEVGRHLEVENPGGVMVTVIEKKGSSPRGMGARMLVLPDGTAHGSVGGGKIEHEAIRQALDVKKTMIKAYDLSRAESAELGMACGGAVTLLYEPMC